jgi:hypothetical protein
MTKHATKMVGGRLEYTGARDADGFLVEATAYDVERMGRAAFDAYQGRRRAEIAAAKAKQEDELSYEAFRREFLASGGAPGDARAAYLAAKREAATQAAREADAAALEADRARMRAVL